MKRQSDRTGAWVDADCGNGQSAALTRSPEQLGVVGVVLVVEVKAERTVKGVGGVSQLSLCLGCDRRPWLCVDQDS